MHFARQASQNEPDRRYSLMMQRVRDVLWSRKPIALGQSARGTGLQVESEVIRPRLVFRQATIVATALKSE